MIDTKFIFILLLLQAQISAVLIPIFECILKAVVELIPTSRQFLAADVCADHQLLHSRRMDTNFLAPNWAKDRRRSHQQATRNQWDKPLHIRRLLNGFTNLLNVIGRFKCAVEYIRARERIVHHSVLKEQHKLFHINTGLYRVLSARIHEIMTLHSFVQSGHIPMLTFTVYNPGADDGQFTLFILDLPNLMDFLCH